MTKMCELAICHVIAAMTLATGATAQTSEPTELRTSDTLLRISKEQRERWEESRRPDSGVWLYSSLTMDGIPGRKRGVPGWISSYLHIAAGDDHWGTRSLPQDAPAQSLDEPSMRALASVRADGWESRAPGEYRLLEAASDEYETLKARGMNPSGFRLKIYEFEEGSPRNYAPRLAKPSPNPLMADIHTGSKETKWTVLPSPTDPDGATAYSWYGQLEGMVLLRKLHLRRLPTGEWCKTRQLCVVRNIPPGQLAVQLSVEYDEWSDFSSELVPGRLVAREHRREVYTPPDPWSEDKWSRVLSQTGVDLVERLLEHARENGPSAPGEFAGKTRLLDFDPGPIAPEAIRIREQPGDIVENYAGSPGAALDPKVVYVVGEDGFTRIPMRIATGRGER